MRCITTPTKLTEDEKSKKILNQPKEGNLLMQNYEHNSLKLESSILPRSKSKTLLASMVLTGAILLSPAISDTYTASADSIDSTEISTQATDITQTNITNSDDATAQSHYNQTNANSVNEYRAENGKSELTQQSDLDEFAKWKIDAFAGEFPTLGDINEFNNAGGNVHEFNGKSVDQQYEDYHGKPAEGWLGENLAYSTGYVPEGTVGALDAQTMKQWKNSAPHNANMLNDNYGSIGTAYWSNGDGTYYTVQVFESGERVVQEVEPPAPGGDTDFDNEDSQIGDIDDNTDNIGTLDPDEDVVVPGEDDDGSYEIPADPVEPEPTPEPEVPAEPETPAEPELNDPNHPEAPDWVDGNQDVYDDADDVETPAEPEPTPEPEVEPEVEAPADDNAPGGDTGVDNEDSQIGDIDDNTDNIGTLDPDEDVVVPDEDDDGSYEIPADPVDPEPTPGEDAEDGNAPEDESTDDESDVTPAPENDADDETVAKPEDSDSEDVGEPENNDSDNATDSEEAVEPEDSNAVDSEDNNSDQTDAEDNTANDATDNKSDNASDTDAGEVVVDPETDEPVLITPEAPVMPEAVVDARNPRETESVNESDADENDDNVVAPSKSTDTPSKDAPVGDTSTDSTDADASSDAPTESEPAKVTNGASSVVAKSDAPAKTKAIVDASSNDKETVASTIDPSDVEAVDASEETVVTAESLPDTGVADTGKTTLFGAIAALLGAGTFAITRRKRSEEK